MRHLILAALSVCASSAAAQGQALDITLKQGSHAEAQTREQLQRLLKAYDVSRWIFTTSISIDEKSIPHSHPVLTLHARHVHDEELLLSTFVHEQLHWFVVAQQRVADTQQAVNDLQALFPGAPTRPPEGSDGEFSTYQHLLVCYLEYRADQELLGELKARQVMEFWTGDHYTWIYQTVLQHPREIGNIIAKYKLIP
ncbi:MAG: hypothetical protein JWL71_1058 [Acidobacteria bacterium]|nr:hypothetical protein [Acidobacteriota bacterium]